VRLELILSVVDSHPDSTHTLRIDAPFPALEAYAKGLDLGSMDSMEHSHVPWVVLLVKAASTWKDSVGDLVTPSADDQHGGQVPRDLSDDGGPDEQREFKALLNGMRHKLDEENFDEALAQAYQVWGESQVGQLLYKW
jgi:amyloid beta precursor protein binding protein 1